MTLRVGQRFLWTCSGYEFIAEIIDVSSCYAYGHKSSVVQVIGHKCPWKLAQIIESFGFNQSCNWSYLEGQDKPK